MKHLFSNYKSRTVLLFLFIFVLATSCNLHFEKRRYRPGYHVEVMNSHKDLSKTKENTKIPVKLTKLNFVAMEKQKDSILVSKILPVSTNTTNLEPEKHIPVSKKHILGGDSCDVVYMVKGERINAIVIEIGEDYVHYKKCDDPKGRLYTVKTKDIDNITLRNGEYFIPKDRQIVDKEKERKKSQALFVMSIIAGAIAIIAFIFSFFIHPFGVIAFSFAIIDMLYTFILMLVNIRPTRFAPSFRTRFTWIICAIVLILLIAAFVIMFI